MKKLLLLLAGFVAGVGVGAPIGWIVRKKTSEVQFVETTEDEQIAAMIANGDTDMIPINKNDISRPASIQEAIDKAFERAEIPDNLKANVEKDIQNEMNREAGIKQMDTQKVQYFKQWKEEASIAEKYDTTTKDLPDEIAELPDDVQKFVDEVDEDNAGEDDMSTGRPKIDPASEEDWDRWSTSNTDGAYDCVEIYWFDEDDVLSYDDGQEVKNPEKFIGFDVRAQFDKTKPGKNPDIRYVYNHRQGAIFKLIRRHTSFSRKRGMEEYGSEYSDDEDDSDDYLRSRI